MIARPRARAPYRTGVSLSLAQLRPLAQHALPGRPDVPSPRRPSAVTPRWAPVTGHPAQAPAGRSPGGAAGRQGWGALEEPDGRITVREEVGGHALHLIGDVDAPVLEQLARDHPVDQLRVLAVDVGELGYIDSSGLAFLLRCAQAAHAEGRRVQMRRAASRFERVLEVSGLTPLFDLV